MSDTSRVPGKFECLRRLGTDGPFLVEVARPATPAGSGQPVLLKRLLPDWQASATARKNFLADTLQVARLSHPCIARVRRAGVDDLGLYVVSSYTPGVSLSAILRRIDRVTGQLTQARAIKIVRKACEGLVGAHTSTTAERPAGVVHGALSPRQILLTLEDDVLLKDFGLHWLYEPERPGSRHRLGADEITPEQVQGRPPDARSDLFGLGRLLGTLLEHACGSRGEFTELVEQCLQPDPASRVQSASEFLLAFDTLAELVESDWEQTDLRELVQSLVGKGRRPAAAAEASGVRATRQSSRAPTHRPESSGGSLLDPEAFWSFQFEADASGEVDEVTDRVTAKVAVPPATEPPPPLDQPAPPSLPPPLQLEDSSEEPASESLDPTATGPVSEPSPVARTDAPEPGSLPPPLVLNPNRVKTSPVPKERPAISISRPPSAAGQQKPVSTLWLLLGGALAAAVVVGLFVLLRGPTDTSDKEIGGVVDAPQDGSEGTTPDAGEAAADRAGGDRAQGTGNQTESVPEGPGTEVVFKITSDPTGAVVFLNGEKRGATPTEIKDVFHGGKLEIRVEADGFQAWTHEVELGAKKLAREFHAGLLKEEECKLGVGWVYVSTRPAGAMVELDEKRLPGETPMVINRVCAQVPHTIRVQAVGFRPWRKKFSLESGKVLNLTVDLEK